MLLAKTVVKPSPIGGLGLFAGEAIAKGTVTWRFTPKFDVEFTYAEIAQQPEAVLEFLTTYAYFHEGKNRYVLVGDNDRYINHCDNPNIGICEDTDAEEGCEYALRNIAAGEEMTVDYRIFDSRHDTENHHTILKP